MSEDKNGSGNENNSLGAQAWTDRAGAVGPDCRDEERNRKLRHMISFCRHDINNQLTIVNGYLSLLETGTMKTGEVIGILQNATARIERILKFTREYQDLGVNTPAWQDLGATLHTARAAIETGPVRFLPGEECPGLEIFADPLLPRVFSSLIENSLRHGGKVTEIRVRCVTGPSGLVILYEDNGTGIPAAVRPVLFEHGKGKNAGYGLFLAGEILGMTGLALTETGEPGRGVRFEISVPEYAFRMAGNHP